MKNKFVVLSYPQDDSDITPDILIVDSSFYIDQEVGKKLFEKDFARYLEQAQRDNPEEWDVGEVYKLLKEWGWKFEIVHGVEVSY